MNKFKHPALSDSKSVAERMKVIEMSLSVNYYRTINLLTDYYCYGDGISIAQYEDYAQEFLDKELVKYTSKYAQEYAPTINDCEKSAKTDYEKAYYIESIFYEFGEFIAAKLGIEE